MDNKFKGLVPIAHGTREEWNATTHILAGGVFIYETDTKQIKITDGLSYYKDLPYLRLSEDSALSDSIKNANEAYGASVLDPAGLIPLAQVEYAIGSILRIVNTIADRDALVAPQLVYVIADTTLYGYDKTNEDHWIIVADAQSMDIAVQLETALDKNIATYDTIAVGTQTIKMLPAERDSITDLVDTAIFQQSPDVYHIETPDVPGYNEYFPYTPPKPVVMMVLDARTAAPVDGFIGNNNTLVYDNGTVPLYALSPLPGYTGNSRRFYNCRLGAYAKTGLTVRSPDPTYFDITPDWTLDFWLYGNGSANATKESGISIIGSVNGTTLRKNLLSITIYGSYILEIALNTSGNQQALSTSLTDFRRFTITAALKTTCHIAIVRSSEDNMFRIFKNGILQHSCDAGPIIESTDNIGSELHFGRTMLDNETTYKTWTSRDYYFTDVRVTKNLARWTSDFATAIPAGNLALKWDNEYGSLSPKPELALLLDYRNSIAAGPVLGPNNVLVADPGGTIKAVLSGAGAAGYPGTEVLNWYTVSGPSPLGFTVRSPDPTYFDITPDWTLDFWLYDLGPGTSVKEIGVSIVGSINGTALRKNILSVMGYGNYTIEVAANTSGNQQARYDSPTDFTRVTTPGATINRAQHIAVVRSSKDNKFRVFKGGVLALTFDAGPVITSTDTVGSELHIGRTMLDNENVYKSWASHGFYITTVRVTRNGARWLSNFTPPIGARPLNCYHELWGI